MQLYNVCTKSKIDFEKKSISYLKKLYILDRDLICKTNKICDNTSKSLSQSSIKPLKKKPRQGWDKAFKMAIKKGDLPEGDMFEGMENNFDKVVSNQI